MRAAPEEYRRLELRAHALLEGVPLHDVWVVDLPGGGPGRSVLDVQSLFAGDGLRETPAAVRALFALRRGLGRALGWDRDPPRGSERSFLHAIPASDRESSLVPPGTRQGPFRVLFVSPREAIAEVLNATVHAFSVQALVERDSGYRLYWAIHVLPVGRITRWYMRAIDPFRRWVVYPALLRRLRSAWERDAAVRETGRGRR